MIIAEQLTKEQRQVQIEINSHKIENMSFEKYKKSYLEKEELKKAKEDYKSSIASA